MGGISLFEKVPHTRLLKFVSNYFCLFLRQPFTLSQINGIIMKTNLCKKHFDYITRCATKVQQEKKDRDSVTHPINLLCAGFEFFCAAIIAVLLFTNLRKGDKIQRFLTALTVSLLLTVLIDIPTWLWQDNSRVFIKILLLLGYTLSYISVALFHGYLVNYLNQKAGMDKRFLWFAVPGTVVMPVLWFISLFNGMFFTIDAAGNYVHGPYYPLSQWVGATIGLLDIILILSCRKKLKPKHKAALLSYEILPMLAISFETPLDSVPLFAAMTISLLILYMVLNAEQEMLLLENNLALSEGRSALVLSQIQPHFLYNSLTSIYRLCDVDSSLAKQAISDFSVYLRGNLNSLKQNTLISFQEELRHIKAYLNLEKIRYDEYLEVQYDISAAEFLVPALSIQPLVENAVNHGISDMPDGGRITVKTWENADFYVISVADNGVGFDAEIPVTDSKNHVGIATVRNKLAIMCHGTLEITASPGNGTTATVKIPKGDV